MRGIITQVQLYQRVRDALNTRRATRERVRFVLEFKFATGECMSDFTLVGSEMHKVSFCGVSHNLICDGATLQPVPGRRRRGETR